MSTQPSKLLSEYRMKSPPVIKAVEIDGDWLQFLKKERGFKTLNIGDYYLIGIDGAEWVLPTKQFNRLFEAVDGV